MTDTITSERDSLKSAMNMWRNGFGPLPTEYITTHRRAAESSIPEMLAKLGFDRVIFTEMVSDGWGDGMRTLRVVCEDRLDALHDMRWSDANGGSWFKKCPSGGQALEFTPADRPGYI